MDSVTHFGRGVLSQGWDTLKGIGQVITHPVETAEGVYHAATHPRETWQGIRQGVTDAFRDNPAEASGRAVFEVAALFTPAVFTKVATAARVARATDVAADASKVARLADTASDAGKAGRAANTASDAGKAGRAADAAANTRNAGRTADGAANTRNAGRAADGAAGVTRAAALSDDVLAGVEQLPRSGEARFGHWASKHGPKTAEQAADTAATLKPGKSTTWFASEDAMRKTLASAPDELRGVLANDPKKLQEFQQFMSTPKEGGAFGFRFKVPGQASIGEGVAGGGQRLANDGTAYVSYKWTKGEGGVLTPQVFTAYPVGTPR